MSEQQARLVVLLTTARIALDKAIRAETDGNRYKAGVEAQKAASTLARITGEES